jgi:hypothetical protein
VLHYIPTKHPIAITNNVCSYLHIFFSTSLQEKRKTAETKMNAESSRSHAIFVIQISQKIDIRTPLPLPAEGTETSEKSNKNSNKHPQKQNIIAKIPGATFTSQVIERNSKICLIDLAGSERINTTGATGDRLKEATNINSSLSTLGEVIRKLSDKGKNNTGKGGGGDKDVHVPYRNSVLTWILKDSLGGNSKTAIVATVSPSEASYSESMSTLRYLERAKFVETNAVINENNSQDPYIKHLQHQLSAYKTKLNTALAQNRQQDREHKSVVKAMTEELESLRSRSSTTHPHTTGDSDDISNMRSGSFDEDMVVKQLSSDDLAVTLGSEIDLKELLESGRGIGRDLSDGGCSESSGEEGHVQARAVRRRFDRSPSKRGVLETTCRGRTKEYFENECYDLQDSLARSMMECNSLRERLVEVEDLHNIEIDILNEELQSLAVDNDDASGGATEELNAVSVQHKESINNLQVTIERLQMRLHEKDLDLLAEKTRAQEDVEASNQLLYNLECEIETHKKTIQSSSEAHERLLSDYNELAINFAKLNAEKDGCLAQQEGEISDLKGEVEVLKLVLASKEEIIAMHKVELRTKDSEAMKYESTNEEELKSLKAVIDMYKTEIADREERLSLMGAVLAEKEAVLEELTVRKPPAMAASGSGSGTGSSLLDELEEEATREEEEDEEEGEGSDDEDMLEAYKVQVSALEETLAAERLRHEEETVARGESTSLLEEDFRSRILALEEEMEHSRAEKEEEDLHRFEEKVEMLMKLVQIAENARREAEEQVAAHDDAVREWEASRTESERQIKDLQEHLLAAEASIYDWEMKEGEWDEAEENYEKVIHTLTDEIEVMEVDHATKNACLELFESQLVTQDNELKSSQAKHEEVVHALTVDAEVMHIYLTAKEENVEALEEQLAAKESELAQLAAEKQLIEEGLTIELESFKLALAGKEESHQELVTKLEEANQNIEKNGMSAAELQEEMTALVMEIEILKQGISDKERVAHDLRQSLEALNEEADVACEAIAEKDEQISRLMTVDIPRLKRELLAKEQDFEATLQQSDSDRLRLEQENDVLHKELESRRLLDAAVPGKKSKFICF